MPDDERKDRNTELGFAVLLLLLSACTTARTKDPGSFSTEDGCSIDVPIETGTMPITELADDPYVGFIASWIGEDAEIPAYRDCFDDARLDAIVNDWFWAAAQADEAA